MDEMRAHWDARYADAEYVFGTEANDFLRAQRHRIPAGPVLCIGDGEGRNGVHLAEAGHAVTSVDVSDVGLAKARALAQQRAVVITTVAADLQDFVHERAAAGPWSAVVSIFCHLPSEVRAAIFPPLVAALAPGGVFVLESYTPDQIGRGTGGPPDPDMLLTGDKLRAELPGLTIEVLTEQVRDVQEGRQHSGISAVVQYVGRKPVSAPAPERR
jgi:SAM-dependent methyltransferase